jgi:hypothetical protein
VTSVSRDDARSCDTVGQNGDDSVQNGGQQDVRTFPPFQAATSSNTETADLRRELIQLQVSIAGLTQRVSIPPVAVSIDLPSTTPGNMTSFLTGTVTPAETPATQPTSVMRVTMDTLPDVHLVPNKVRTDIHAHKHVNLAMLLIPGLDLDSHTKIIDTHGTQIVVQANDTRLQRELPIEQFRSAFARFKNVLFEVEPERRKEFDIYSNMIEDLSVQYGGTFFYDYHNAFSRKAERHAALGILVDWASGDTSLFLRIFSGRKSATCNSCASTEHISDFCPKSLTNVNPTLDQTATDYRPSYKSRNPPVSADKIDTHGRPRLFHNRQEICNNFNSQGRCFFKHKGNTPYVHVCSRCKSAEHGVIDCPQQSSNAAHGGTRK